MYVGIYRSNDTGEKAFDKAIHWLGNNSEV